MITKQMNEARSNKILDQQVRYDGIVKTRRQFIIESIEKGSTLKIYQINKIKDLSRVAFNRMNGFQQDEFEKKQKAAGKIDEYNIVHEDESMHTITKTEYDFALSLLA